MPLTIKYISFIVTFVRCDLHASAQEASFDQLLKEALDRGLVCNGPSCADEDDMIDVSLLQTHTSLGITPVGVEDEPHLKSMGQWEGEQEQREFEKSNLSENILTKDNLEILMKLKNQSPKLFEAFGMESKEEEELSECPSKCTGVSHWNPIVDAGGVRQADGTTGACHINDGDALYCGCQEYPNANDTDCIPCPKGTWIGDGRHRASAEFCVVKEVLKGPWKCHAGCSKDKEHFYFEDYTMKVWRASNASNFTMHKVVDRSNVSFKIMPPENKSWDKAYGMGFANYTTDRIDFKNNMTLVRGQEYFLGYVPDSTQGGIRLEGLDDARKLRVACGLVSGSSTKMGPASKGVSIQPVVRPKYDIPNKNVAHWVLVKPEGKYFQLVDLRVERQYDLRAVVNESSAFYLYAEAAGYVPVKNSSMLNASREFTRPQNLLENFVQRFMLNNLFWRTDFSPGFFRRLDVATEDADVGLGARDAYWVRYATPVHQENNNLWLYGDGCEQQWREYPELHILPGCTLEEYGGRTTPMSFDTAYECMSIASAIPGINMVVWRGDDYGACHICTITSRFGIYEPMAKVVSFERVM